MKPSPTPPTMQGSNSPKWRCDDKAWQLSDELITDAELARAYARIDAAVEQYQLAKAAHEDAKRKAQNSSTDTQADSL